MSDEASCCAEGSVWERRCLLSAISFAVEMRSVNSSAQRSHSEVNRVTGPLLGESQVRNRPMRTPAGTRTNPQIRGGLAPGLCRSREPGAGVYISRLIQRIA